MRGLDYCALLNKFENDESFMKFNRFKKGLARDLGLNLLSVLFKYIVTIKFSNQLVVVKAVYHLFPRIYSAES